MTIITRDNAHVGMFVHDCTILGNLLVQVITDVNDEWLMTEYLMPHKGYTKHWYFDDDKYSKVRYLAIIEDPVSFVWSTPRQARYIIENDCRGLGQRVYDHCWSALAIDIVWNLKTTPEWKDKDEYRKVWKYKDYIIPNDDRVLREARSWRKSDRQFNGPAFWTLVAYGGERDEWTDLRTCLRRTALWFDDSRYIQKELEHE